MDMFTFSNIILFVFLCVIMYLNQYISLKYQNNLAQFIISIVFAIILFLSFKMTSNKDNFRFEVTPGKDCCGPYMMDPKYREMCSKLPENVLRRSCCGSGYNGSPLATGCLGNIYQIVDHANSLGYDKV